MNKTTCALTLTGNNTGRCGHDAGLIKSMHSRLYTAVLKYTAWGCMLTTSRLGLTTRSRQAIMGHSSYSSYTFLRIILRILFIYIGWYIIKNIFTQQLPYVSYYIVPNLNVTDFINSIIIQLLDRHSQCIVSYKSLTPILLMLAMCQFLTVIWSRKFWLNVLFF